MIKRGKISKLLKKAVVLGVMTCMILSTAVTSYAASDPYAGWQGTGNPYDEVPEGYCDEIILTTTIEYVDDNGNVVDGNGIEHMGYVLDIYKNVYDIETGRLVDRVLQSSSKKVFKNPSITYIKDWITIDLKSGNGLYAFTYDVEIRMRGCASTFRYVSGKYTLNQEVVVTCKLSDVMGLDPMIDPDLQYTPNIFGEDVVRVKGQTRYETSIETAKKLKESLGVEKFDTVIVATGENYADALSGSYLASILDAPILMSNVENTYSIVSFMKEHVTADGKIYILGGEAAVSAYTESIFKLNGFNVERLSGKTRYETNIEILKEAGVKDTDILVCTGKNFADSLSASAIGKPILLVGDALSDTQKNYLTSVSVEDVYIIGGEGAVNKAIAGEMNAYDADGYVERIYGATRYETSIKVANTFFEKPEYAVLAYAQNFPDGLCGGPLAYAMGAPMILTDSVKPGVAVTYGTINCIKKGVVLGGNILVTDKVVKDFFGIGDINHNHEWVESVTVVHHEEEGEYQKVLVKEAWTEEVPVYKKETRAICNGCGEDITGNPTAHMKPAMLAGNLACGGYHTESRKVQVGTDTIEHPAEYETKWVVTKEAWCEEIVSYKCSCGATK